MKIIKWWTSRSFSIIICIQLFFSIASSAQSNKIPLDPAVRYGKLENGFQYYILNDSSNSEKIELMLTVNAGFFDEDPDQAGLAHLVEHIALRSTTHFPMGVRRFFIGKGLVSGRDINASTNMTTDYSLTIPAGNPEMLNFGLLAASDFAGGISFKINECDEERSAVIREASNANNPSFFAVLETNYLLSDKNPMVPNSLTLLRDMENVSTTGFEPLIRFYKDWYHPMHQVLFVSGDLNVDEVENKIEQHFSNLTNDGVRQKTDDLKSRSVLLRGDNKLVTVSRGKGNTKIDIAIYKLKENELNKEALGTEDEIKIRVSDRLVDKMLINRFRAMRDYTFAPIPETFYIDRTAINPMAKVDGLVASQTVRKTSETESAIRSLIEEFTRLQKFGFSETEFKRLRDEMISPTQKGHNRGDIIHRLYNFHFEGRVFPQNENEIEKKIIEGLSVKQVNDKLMAWLNSKGNFRVLLSVPDAFDPGVPTESEVIFWISDAQKKKVVAFREPEIKPLPVPTESSIAKYVARELPGLGATYLEFANGAKVIIKPFGKDMGDHPGKIQLRGINNAEHAEESNLSLIKDAASFIGFPSVTAAEVKFLKKDRKVHVMPFVNEGGAEIVGSANSEAETMLQLVYAYMAKSAMDTEAFKDYCLFSDRDLDNPVQATPSIENYVDKMLGTTRSTIKPIGKYSKSKSDEILKTYKKYYGNAADFTFVITGNFDKDEMVRLVSRYIGAIQGLPQTQLTPRTLDQQTKFEPGHITMIGDSINNVRVRMFFRCMPLANEKEKVALRVANIVLRESLFRRLREKEKGVYGVLNQIRTNKYTQENFLDVEFETAPADVDRLVAATQNELSLFSKGIFSKEVFSTAIADIRPDFEYEQTSSHYFWTNYLLECDRVGSFEPTDELKRLEILEALTPDDISKVVREHLNVNDLMVFKIL